MRHLIFDNQTRKIRSMRVTDPKTGRTFYSKRRRRFDSERMPRELTFTCFKGYPFLSRERTRAWFVEAVHEQRQKWPVDFYAWVIMPEHVHLIVTPREPGVSIGSFQGDIKEQVARNAIR
jgi:putative transposase